MATRAQILAEIGVRPLWGLHQEGKSPQPARQREQKEQQQAQPQSLPPQLSRTEVSKTEVMAHPPTTSPALADPANISKAAEAGWMELHREIKSCQRCDLCRQRKQAVPGVGDLHPDWLLVGEGPGAEEDARGEPFVGQAGKLLDNMLAALDLRRDNKVYIANVVKCRPPGNRTPSDSEIAACKPFLDRQIALLLPKIILLLGKSAVHGVMQIDAPLGRQRKQHFDYKGIPVVVTYHPAYLLRNLPDKIKAWEDLLYARNVLRGDV